MFAIGAVALSNIGTVVRSLWTAVVLANAALAMPVVLPLLSPASLTTYLAKTHLRLRPEEVAALGAPLTQVFSDEFGWRELAAQVGDIYRAAARRPHSRGDRREQLRRSRGHRRLRP